MNTKKNVMVHLGRLNIRTKNLPELEWTIPQLKHLYLLAKKLGHYCLYLY